MVFSRELIYGLTRNHNSFLRKNLDRTFTADPFSTHNIPNATATGFYDRSAVALHSGKANKEGKIEASLTSLRNKRRVTKKGKKSNHKAAGRTVSVKNVDTKKITGHKSPALQSRGVRIHQAALRSAKFNKK